MLSLAGRILVANQVLLASIWYLVACWNPNPRMCCQVRGVETPLWPSVWMKLTLPKLGTWSPPGLLNI